MSPVDRRTFLRNMAIVSAAAAGSAVAPAHLAALTPGTVRDAQGRPTWHRTPCRMCGVGCGLLVGIEDGRAVAVKGDPDSPVSSGLACAKGYYSVQALYGRDRITHAMVRSNGALVEVPMREALDLVARKMRETVAQHGKDSVGMYGSAQWSVTDAYVASKFMKGALGTNNLDTNARLYTASATAGTESTFGLTGAIGCFEDIDHADVFVLWNVNLAETDPVLFSRMLARKQANPAVRIIDLSTRTTRTSYAADYSLVYAPHAELAVANALCQEIVARNWVNRAFVDRYAICKRGPTGIGYDLPDDAPGAGDAMDATWKDYVAFLSAYSPERAQQLSGVPAESIRWLASLYGDRSLKVVSAWGTAVNRHARGTWLNNVLHNIHLLVGKIATPGSGSICLTGQPGSGAPHDAGAAPNALPGGAVLREADRRRASQIWGVPRERIDPRTGRSALSMFRALERGDMRFLWIQATNPMVSLPHLGKYRRAVGRSDRFVVVSEVYPTATTDVADVVLPASMWIEREGVFVNAERRAQHFDQMVKPPGDAMSDTWQMIEVARRLGHTALFPWERDRHVEQIWDEYRRFLTDRRHSMPRFAELRSGPGALWPSGNGRETQWRCNTALDPAADRARGDYDFYGHQDHRARIWLRPHEPPAEAPDGEYPFWLTTGSVLEHWGTGSMTQRIPLLHRAVPRAYVEINRDDAKRLGIRNGEMVRLVSRRGSLDIEARIDQRGQPPRGLLFAPSFDETLKVNRLTLDACCPISGQPDGKCAVRVERLSAGGRT